MKGREALNTICSECQKYKGKIQVACPFRSISNDYCDEYEQIEKDLEVLEIIKSKYVDIWNIKATFTVKQYNNTITKYDGWEVFNLTESEYTKVKEWLKNE